MAYNSTVKDSRNPYSTGVLVGNYVEDKFGCELAAEEVSSLSHEINSPSKYGLESLISLNNFVTPL